MIHHIELGTTVRFYAISASSPTVRVRLAGAAADAAPVHSPSAVLLTHANYPANLYEIVVVCSAGNGFAEGNQYEVLISAPTAQLLGEIKTIGVRSTLGTGGLSQVQVESGIRLLDFLAIAGAALGGKCSGAGTLQMMFQALGNPLTNRIIVDVDSNSNRLTVTLSLPA